MMNVLMSMLNQKRGLIAPSVYLGSKKLFMITATEGKRPFTLMICDNLDSHVHADFLQALKDEGAQRNLLVAGETEMLQSIDRGAGANVKMLAGQVQDEWLDEDDNFAAWEGDPDASFK